MPPLPEREQYVSGPRRFEPQRFAEWRSQALNLLRSALPEGHTYVLEFEERVVNTEEEHVKSGVGILTALREDLDRGYLAGLRQLIASEVFTDFLEIADHLLEAGYFHAAASVSGAVLEDVLRRELVGRGLKPGRNLESLNQTWFRQQPLLATCVQAGEGVDRRAERSGSWRVREGGQAPG